MGVLEFHTPEYALDPKTRASDFSDHGKVAVQTEKAAQYTYKALAAGASADEISDAPMMLCSALGPEPYRMAVEVLPEAGVEGFALPEGAGRRRRRVARSD